MCNRYASDIRKAGLEAEYYGFEEWSETRIKNTILEVFPDRVGPVIRQRADGSREWTPMRWGLPGPASTGGAPVTNLRNVQSPHWRRVLGPAHRCLVPFTAFAEYQDGAPKGLKPLRWFAPPSRTLAMFAGVWREWTGVRGTKAAPIEGAHLLFTFLTTEANALVRPIHAKAMPLVLTGEDAYARWLNASAAEVEAIQAQPIPEDALEVLSEDEASVYEGMEELQAKLKKAQKRDQGGLF
jgi:putative SOS response-associated peptidase YedK